ncbi:hypothetical protein ACN2C7_01805 [Caulobacter sp. ErkDOM-E]|uniref:hypothetical protein n=1 Tax=Caulobacter sp. ErkDOM-E TaxID=3402778 RepID=UPI003AF5B2AE
MHPLKRLLFVAAIPVAFAAGVAGSDGIRSTIWMFRGSVDIDCIDHAVCVGAEAPAVFSRVNRDRYGLTSVFCEDASTPDKFIRLDQVVAGKTCETSNFRVELRNPTLRTLIKVRGGKVTGITQGPLHVIDL